MSLVSITTMFKTVQIALLILISKGWQFARSVLTRNDLSTLSIIMGIVYLSYSTYFITFTMPKMQRPIELWMDLLITFNMVYIIRSCHCTKRAVIWHASTYEGFTQLSQTRIMMIDCFKFITGIYLFFQILFSLFSKTS